MTTRDLSPNEVEQIQDRRKAIEELLTSEAEEHHTAAEKLMLLSLMLKPEQLPEFTPFMINAMGVMLGDALCQVLGLEWVVVENENDDSVAVGFPNTMIFAYPLDAIQKRIDRKEDIDIFYLFVGIAESISEMNRSGN